MGLWLVSTKISVTSSTPACSKYCSEPRLVKSVTSATAAATLPPYDRVTRSLSSSYRTLARGVPSAEQTAATGAPASKFARALPRPWLGTSSSISS